jgi:hypothetical protein
MKYHCGLLDERPENSRTLNWIKQGTWGRLPPEIEHELRVWLAMPGFSISYHCHTLRRGRTTIIPNLGGFEELEQEVAENWLSATRDDCVKLSRMRPGTGNVPLISQLRAVQDLKKMRQVDVARDYRITVPTLVTWASTGFRTWGQLPVGFELLTA